MEGTFFYFIGKLLQHASHGFEVYNNISIALSVSKENKVVCFLLFILLFHLVGLWLSHLVACIEIKIQLKAGCFFF